jgi:hypothetical protein
VATIADHIGLEKGSKMANKIAHYFAHAPPSLLVLDNLETTWENFSSRSEVEEFLSLLTDVPHLGLMVSNVFEFIQKCLELPVDHPERC